MVGLQGHVQHAAAEAEEDAHEPAEEVDEPAEDPQVVDESGFGAHGVVLMPHNHLAPAWQCLFTKGCNLTPSCFGLQPVYSHQELSSFGRSCKVLYGSLPKPH